MINNPLVTIAIPNFNQGKYLRDSIQSATLQSYQNLEILISDNCSTDNSWDIIEEFVIKDRRIRAWKNDENIGPFPNWDKLFFNSRGIYFKILPADDILRYNFIETAVKEMIEKNATFFLAGYQNIGLNDSFQRPRDYGIPCNICLNDHLKAKHLFSIMNYVMPTPSLMKKEAICEGYGGTRYSFSRDFVLASHAIVRGNIVADDNILSYQRIHSEQGRNQKDTSESFRDYLEGSRILSEIPGAMGKTKIIVEITCARFLGYAFKKLVYGDFLIAFKVLSVAFKNRILFRGLLKLPLIIINKQLLNFHIIELRNKQIKN